MLRRRDGLFFLVAGILLAPLVVAGSLTTTCPGETGPCATGLPAVGWVGFAVALLIAGAGGFALARGDGALVVQPRDSTMAWVGLVLVPVGLLAFLAASGTTTGDCVASSPSSSTVTCVPAPGSTLLVMAGFGLGALAVLVGVSALLYRGVLGVAARLAAPKA